MACCLLGGWARAAPLGNSSSGLDPSFAGKGFVVDSRMGRAEVAEDVKGRLLIAGGAGGELVVARYLADGDPDPSFGSEGIARLRLPGFGAKPATLASVGDVAVQADGKLLIGGSFQSAAGTGLGPSAVLARLQPNGALDTSFGNTSGEEGQPGVVILPARDAIDAISIEGRKILVGGTSGRGFVGRFNSDGSLDRGFGGGRLGGWFNLPPRPKWKTRVRVDASVEGLLAGPGRTIYAAGSANGKFMLARLRYDGRLDRHFGRGGLVTVDAAGRPGCNCSIGEGLARDHRGRLLVSGSLLSRHQGAHQAVAVARFDRNGGLDRSFAGGGIARTRAAPETWGGPLAIQPDGRIVVAGSIGKPNGTYRLVLLAYRPDGKLDPTFFGSGVFEPSLGAASSEATDLLVDRHGGLVVAGGARFGGHAGLSGLLARVKD